MSSEQEAPYDYEVEQIPKPVWEQIRDTVRALEGFAQDLNRLVMDINELPVEEAARRLYTVRQTIAKLQDSEAAIERWIADVFKDQGWKRAKEFDVGLVEVKRSKNRRGWEHEALAKDFLAAWLEQNADEGIAPSPWEVKDALLKVAGIGYWKVGELQKLGIDADEYCQHGYGPPKVEIQE